MSKSIYNVISEDGQVLYSFTGFYLAHNAAKEYLCENLGERLFITKQNGDNEITLKRVTSVKYSTGRICVIDIDDLEEQKMRIANALAKAEKRIERKKIRMSKNNNIIIAAE